MFESSRLRYWVLIHLTLGVLLSLVFLSCGEKKGEVDLDSFIKQVPKSGFYEENFIISFDSRSFYNCSIIYSKDGSSPSSKKIDGFEYHIKSCPKCSMNKGFEYSYLYNQPIEVSNLTSSENKISSIENSYRHFNHPINKIPKAFTFHAKLFCKNDTLEATPKTYFIGKEFEKFKGFPILSLHTAPSNLFDYFKGINVPGVMNDSTEGDYNENYHQRGKKWERPVFAEFFNENGQKEFEQNLGLRIHGNTSREFSNRSFRIYARKKYGSQIIEHPFFGKKHKRMKLRTSGQDQNQTYFRDGLVAKLFENSELTIENYKPLNLFINGEYWGIFNLRERFDKHYVSANLEVDKDSVKILKGWFKADKNEEFKSFREYLKNRNLDTEDAFNYIFNKIHLYSFLEHKISEIYFGRWDVSHWQIWKNKNDPDSKWRWVLWDFDVGMGLPNDWGPEWSHGAKVDANYLKHFLIDYKVERENFELVHLLKNERIKHLFINRFMQLMHSNLSQNYINTTIDSIYQKLLPVVTIHLERWMQNDELKTIDEWENNISILKSFAQKRFKHVVEHLKEQFDLEDLVQVEFKNIPSDNDIIINGQKLTYLAKYGDEIDSWTCHYFKNIPIEIEVSDTENFKGISLNGEFQIEDRFFRLPFKQKENKVEFIFSEKNDV